jgi:hypothetical protein
MVFYEYQMIRLDSEWNLASLWVPDLRRLKDLVPRQAHLEFQVSLATPHCGNGPLMDGASILQDPYAVGRRHHQDK